jgi:hypothetical protein
VTFELSDQRDMDTNPLRYRILFALDSAYPSFGFEGYAFVALVCLFDFVVEAGGHSFVLWWV